MTQKIQLVILLTILSLKSIVVYAQASSVSGSPFVTRATSKTASAVVKELKENIEKKGLKIFGEIAHHTEAEKAGELLGFTTVIIFGNPKAGTVLMRCDQQIGYELPLRILVTTNDEGKTQISYKDPKNYSTTYELKDCVAILEKMSSLLDELTKQVL